MTTTTDYDKRLNRIHWLIDYESPHSTDNAKAFKLLEALVNDYDDDQVLGARRGSMYLLYAELYSLYGNKESAVRSARKAIKLQPRLKASANTVIRKNGNFVSLIVLLFEDFPKGWTSDDFIIVFMLIAIPLAIIYSIYTQIHH